MKLKNKFLDLLSLSLLWIKDSATVKAVTDDAQSFSGIKTLADMASSPNSTDDIDAMPATEVITHKAMNTYLGEMVKPPLSLVTAPAPTSDIPPDNSGNSEADEAARAERRRRRRWQLIVPSHTEIFDTRLQVHLVTEGDSGRTPNNLMYHEADEYVRLDMSIPANATAATNKECWPFGTTFVYRMFGERDYSASQGPWLKPFLSFNPSSEPWNEDMTPFSIETENGVQIYVPSSWFLCYRFTYRVVREFEERPY